MVQRLNWGCGANARYGWVNSDQDAGPGVDVVTDIRQGLPLPGDFFDYVVSIHALPEIPYAELDATLCELRRVLRPGGVLRLGLPDLDKAIDAYRAEDIDYFLVGDDIVRSLAGKMIVQLTWFGRSRSMFTADFTTELLARNGFADIMLCACGETHTEHPGIVDLDNRPLESLFVEARKPR